MRRLAAPLFPKALLTCAALLAGMGLPVVESAEARPQGPTRFYADPSDILASEIALDRLAREKGQWAAYRATAAADAVMFVPQQVTAPLWLKGRKDMPVPVRREAWKAYVSCDGRLAAATGGWRAEDGAQGYFTTIWRRNEKGEWQWVLDHGDRLAAARDHADFLEGHVASCKGLPGGHRSADAADGPPPPPAQGGKQGPPLPDRSLLWSYEVGADGGRSVQVKLWTGSGYDLVIDDKVGPAQ